MIHFAKPGTYVIKADSAKSFAQSLVAQWLDAQDQSKFKGCLWFTTRPQQEVRDFIEPHMDKPHSFLKGLDVVSTRSMLKQGSKKATVKHLCRSLESLTVLKPVLIVLEAPSLWLNNTEEALDQRNAHAHMRLLNRWANHANACVVTPVETEAPRWAVFADGYADVTIGGEFEYKPWWPTDWGVQTDLWNNIDALRTLPTHHLIDATQCGGLKEVATICHHLRFGQQEQAGIHVLANETISTQDASVLLRLGADCVNLGEQEDHLSNYGISPEQVRRFDPDNKPSVTGNFKFGQDLHEVFMPGMLTIVDNQVFAREGLMMLQLAEHWNMHLSLTRLSLLPHMSAQTALRLCNWTEGTCVFTATREAVYIMKLWIEQPEEQHYNEWLGNCFREETNVLFSGGIQFEGASQQSALFTDLYDELEPVQHHTLPENEIKAPDALTDVWVENPLIRDPARPWMQRIHALIKESH